MNNSKNIANYIQIKFHDERPLYVISVGGVSEEDTDGSIKYVVAVTDKDRIYKITVEAL
jgi:hypothetical protein